MRIAPSRQQRHAEGPGTPAPKRLLDLLIASAALGLGAPVLAVVAAAIVLESRGPVHYTQIRAGRQGRPFRMFKFRTMVAHAERETGPIWASESDPRVTRVGALLRRTRLDEVPQLLNVLRGEMSLVGPRPERPAMVRRLAGVVPGYLDRCGVLPGITGLAQVRKGYDHSIRTVKQKVRHDRCYIRRNGSFWLDLKIIAATPAVMLLGAGGWRKTPGRIRRRREAAGEGA